MISLKSKILVAAIVFTTVSALSFGALSASANFWAGDTDMTKTFAQKLGVSEDKVKEAMTSMRTEHQAEMKADLASK
ncbi:MAG: hypothetical protein KBD46_02890, partial [Candidatus Levybacteria bacterium]|nr:hypothetical protein [Candidatus Levybacteria bacterium]